MPFARNVATRSPRPPLLRHGHARVAPDYQTPVKVNNLKTK